LAKGLLLKGDTQVELVVLCGKRPTHSLLDYIAMTLPGKLQAVSSGENAAGAGAGAVKYHVEKQASNAALIVKVTEKSGGNNRQLLHVKVTLTSPLMREDPPNEAATATPSGVAILNRAKCLEALAALRHAKWFQARACGRQSCIMVIRVLRDLCRTVPALRPLRQFTLELLVEKVLASALMPLSPGDAVRRVFESLAAGLLLKPDSPGLLDPCEREPTDAAANLDLQQREDLTAHAQRALRLIAFRQIHRVLAMDSIPPPRSSSSSLHHHHNRSSISSSSAGSSGTNRSSINNRNKRKHDDVTEGSDDVTNKKEIKLDNSRQK